MKANGVPGGRSSRFMFLRFSLYHDAFGLHLIVRVISGACLSFNEVNGSQLAKMKKSIPDMSLP